MSFLRSLLNPPPLKGDSDEQHYKYFNSVSTALSGLTSVSNPSIITNANFTTLGPGGMTPTTQADGDNAEFFDSWFVVGATAATYTITPTTYPANSTVKSSSLYYAHHVVTTTNSNPFYFYQRQSGSVRKYQSENLTYGFLIRNNQSTAIKLRLDIFNFFDPSSQLKTGNTFFLQPGLNNLTSTLTTDSLSGVTVGAGNYTEFRLNFLDIPNGIADMEIYQIKCEVGNISTLLSS